MKLGALDATAETVTASRFSVSLPFLLIHYTYCSVQIRGYPTIKFFPSGPKDYDSAKEYDGGRTSGDIVQWALNHWTEHQPAPEIHEVLLA